MCFPAWGVNEILFVLTALPMLTFLLTTCFKPNGRHRQSPSQLPMDVQLNPDSQFDSLANVEFLTPTLGVACCDDATPKEAQMRHDTLKYLPKLVLQKEAIRDKTSSAELKKLLSRLPTHPSQRFRSKTPSVDDKAKKRRAREEKWRNVHVTFHTEALVFITRATDPCRAKDDDGADTADTKSSHEFETANGPGDEDNPKTPSEIAMTEPECNKKLLGKMFERPPPVFVDTTQPSTKEEHRQAKSTPNPATVEEVGKVPTTTATATTTPREKDKERRPKTAPSSNSLPSK